jgi:hypothetical protein
LAVPVSLSPSETQADNVSGARRAKAATEARRPERLKTLRSPSARCIVMQSPQGRFRCRTNLASKPAKTWRPSGRSYDPFTKVSAMLPKDTTPTPRESRLEASFAAA